MQTLMMAFLKGIDGRSLYRASGLPLCHRGDAWRRGSCATAATKTNILVIMGDDIGYWNVSAYNRGMMGYRTPNIDQIAG